MTCDGCNLWTELEDRLDAMSEEDLSCFVTKAVILLWTKQPGDFDYTFSDLAGGVQAFFKEAARTRMQ